ncbi:pisatin demethylase [Ilyonectria destructans]|nr:pisatin demethylase [Ilyonectria destructans]
MVLAEHVVSLIPSFTGILWLSVLLPVCLVLYRRYWTRLSRFPGPFWASVTDIWRLFMVHRGRPQEEQRELHQRYGDIVRLGPRTLSFANPQAIGDIYSGKQRLRKSEFYSVQRGIRGGHSISTIFSTTDENAHAKLRRGASNAYALTTLLQFEPLVDSTTRVFLAQIRGRWADQPGARGLCDLSTWLQYYAFDVIGELTFSKQMGFLEQGRDVGGIIDAIDRGLGYAGLVGQIPWTDLLLRRNPIKLLAGRLGFLDTTLTHVAYGAEQIRQRKLDLGDKLTQPVKSDNRPRDFLSRFLETHYVHGSISEDQVMSLTQANINAGSDTTAISLRSIFYYLLKTPGCYKNLMAELEAAEARGHFADTETCLVSWTEAQKLPYLDGVVKESLRIFPAVGLSMERMVPDEGLIIAGNFIPGGTIVGCSPWVINFRKDIFGNDADKFNPERWIEADESKMSKMKKYFFTFGMGSHTCIGKNISYLEIYKVVAAVLRNFKVELADPASQWNIQGSWFVKQTDFD